MTNLMRPFLLGLLAFIPSFASAQSHAYQGVFQAELNARHSDRYIGATLTLDGKQKTVEISIQPKMPACAEGFFCAQVMPEPIAYILENASTEVDHCGIVRTIASFDQRPVDGIFLKLTINDNRGNTCPTFAPLAPTDLILEQAFYNRLEGREESSIDTFEGGELVLIEAEEPQQAVPFRGQILDMKAKGKALQLTLAYGGGCKEHAFELDFGTCKVIRLGRGRVKECEASLIHSQGADDMCKAYITKTHSIDLSHLSSPVIVKLAGKRVLVK